VAAKPVTLNIDGKQTATGYFMFEAEGGRANSQSMIGYDNSRIPVHAHVNAEASRVLNVIKTASGHPLEGIIFDLYAVATLKHYLSEDADALVLAPNGSWQQIRETFPKTNCNYVLFNNGTTWNEGKVTFRAVKAEHSDAGAIGVILSAEGKTITSRAIRFITKRYSRVCRLRLTFMRSSYPSMVSETI